MNDLPRQKLKEIIIQYGRDLCDNPKRCGAFLNDYCGQYRREIFLLISALKQGVAKDLLNSGNIPVEVLLGRLINQMQNDLGLTKEAAQYAVESWAQVLDKMPQITTLQKTRRAEQKQETTSSVPTPSRYTQLETLLKAKKFKEADEETRSVMLAVANRQSERWLRVEDAENFPCEELRTIDNLWLKYSEGKFGISVQQEIYKNLGGTKQYDERRNLKLKTMNLMAEQKQETTSSVPTPSRYTQLETLLKAKKFKEADEETRSVMLAVANRQSNGYLRVEDAENFPCKELRTIDNLWLKYSQGKFGISVQQEIYKNLGGTKQFNLKVWESFGDRIGWRSGGSWLYSSGLNFSLSAPTGQLPTCRVGVCCVLVFGGFLCGFGKCGWSSLLSRHVE
uniref:GUN4 domain-containing protein n=1 Tax=Cylindrospermopsis raciborskii TaxID=77022 RepID=UPI002E361B84|nr:GUN4 domain-containing protein [Cylindrospermopsis raciborskii]